MSLRPLAAALAALLLAATIARAQETALRFVDDGGHDLVLAHRAQRIVALAPNLTELVYAAGAGDSLVAVGRFSDYPPAARSKPVVSDAFAVDYEALTRLKPDLILVWGSGTAERTTTKLRSLGLPVYEIEIRNVAGWPAPKAWRRRARRRSPATGPR
jgi:iron complex transport system substrate-binding protein